VWAGDQKEEIRHGHPRFYELLDEMAELHSKKNHDYARGGKPTGNFDRVAKILSNYPNLKLSNPIVIAIVYLLKQFDAVLWMLSGDYEGDVEGIDKRLEDISIYSIIARVLNEENKNA